MREGSSKMENKSSRWPVDAVAVVTLIAIAAMLAISLVNVWTIRRLGQRVAAIESRMGTVRTSEPGQNRVYVVQTAGAQSKGPEGAPVTIVEFSDFQCPFCARVQPTLQRIQETYGRNVRLVWKHLPLPNHREAVAAALAAEAAGRQGKFWEYHDKLFANQRKLQRDALTQYARELQLHMTRFEADFGAREAQGRIDADAAEAVSLGVDGTPGFFINGRFISGAQAFETFAGIIDEELAKVKVPKPAASPN